MISDFPLLELFIQLREPLKLGFEQYELLLEALEKGFGHGGVEEIKSLCQIIWLKSRLTDEEKIFNQLFEEYTQQYQTPLKSRQETAKNVSPSLGSASFSSQNIPAQVSPAIPPRTTPASSPTDFRLPAAYRGSPPIDLTRSEQGYILKMSDFPFIDRPLRQKWRQLRQRVRNGFTDEVDIPMTLQLIARDRVCLDLPRQPRWKNQIQLLFLEDVEGSMIPFRPIVQELFNTVEPRQFQQVDRYYFRNCIGNFVYQNSKGADIIALTELSLQSNTTIAIIISDAGAARQGYNPQRVELTQVFLDYLQPKVKSLIWLNPIPSKRWSATTAEAIAALVHERMFEFPQADLNLALSAAKRGGCG